MTYKNKYNVVHKGLNMVFVVFSLAALGGAAYAMTTMNFNYKSNAGNLTENRSGVLVKKGTPQYSPCLSKGYDNPSHETEGKKQQPRNSQEKTRAVDSEGRSGGPNENANIREGEGGQRERTAADAPYGLVGVGDGNNRDAQKSSCVPVKVQATKAEQFVGKKVYASGVFRNGVFYVTELSNFAPTPNANRPGDQTQRPNRPVQTTRPRNIER